MQRVDYAANSGAGLVETIEEAVHAPAVGVLPLDTSVGPKFEKESSRTTLSWLCAVGPVARDGEPAVSALNDG